MKRAIVAVLAGLLAGEIALRARAEREIARIDADLVRAGKPICTRVSADPELVYEGLPDLCEHNSRGFRDLEHRLQKPARRFRIVVIGDSIAAGYGLDLASSFGRVIAVRLKGGSEAVASARRPEVILLAVTGYSTSQKLVLLEREAVRYKPDLIVWSYALNDPAHPVYQGANGEIGFYHFRPVSRLVDLGRELLFRLEEAIGERGCPESYAEHLHCTYADQVERELSRIEQFSRATGVPILFVIHPVLSGDSLAQYPYRELHQRLAEAAERHGFDVIDGLEVYAGEPVADLRLHPDDIWHPGVRGQRLLGERLAERVAVRYLAAAPPPAAAAPTSPGPAR